MRIVVAGRERRGFCFGGCGVLGMFLRERALTEGESGNAERRRDGQQGHDAAMHSVPPVKEWNECFGCRIVTLRRRQNASRSAAHESPFFLQMGFHAPLDLACFSWVFSKPCNSSGT